MQPFPHPKDATDKIWLKLDNWSWRYICSKVRTTDNRALLYYKLTLWAFDSGELKIEQQVAQRAMIAHLSPMCQCQMWSFQQSQWSTFILRSNVWSYWTTIPNCHVQTSNGLQDIRQNHWTMKYMSQWLILFWGQTSGHIQPLSQTVMFTHQIVFKI